MPARNELKDKIVNLKKGPVSTYSKGDRILTMKFKKSAIELIKMRTSVRSFDNSEIKNLDLKKLEDYIEEINKQTRIKARFTLTVKDDKADKTAKKLGTYGIISGANSFIVGILDKDEKDSLEFGYLFEKIILFATDLGLGTCWLGGTFNKGNFEKNLNLEKNEFIPIVSPVGIKKENPTILDSFMRTAAGSNKRKPWNELFFEENSTKYLNETMAGLYVTPIEMVRLAPSASNKQPWRIIRDKNNFHFFLSRTKGYGISPYDLQKNDMGIAKCHFELTAKELGLKGQWIEIEDIDMKNEWEYICTWSGEE
jgi:nitroreductase